MGVWAIRSQIDPPGPDDNPWAYIAFAMILALAWIVPKFLQYLREDGAEWKSQAKQNTEALRLANDTLERAGTTASAEFAKVQERLSTVDRKVDGILEELRAPPGRRTR